MEEQGRVKMGTYSLLWLCVAGWEGSNVGRGGSRKRGNVEGRIDKEEREEGGPTAPLCCYPSPVQSVQLQWQKELGMAFLWQPLLRLLVSGGL